jgi:aerobic-type carbon monoxide dehydrogenase small subunit (CoxS/CutS family)
MSNRSNSSSSRSGLTRRGFLKGGVVTAAGAAIGDASLDALAQEQGKPAGAGAKIISGTTSVTLNINGKDRKLEIEPRTTLADALRDRVDLTGTKVVCDRGSCSACTVFINGVPTLSCLSLAIDAQGKKIKTIEGVAEGERLHPVQEQFIQHDAMQCGFCTPGMIMSCVALLEQNKQPSLDDVKQATCGNLCRCGTYPKVFDATLAAAKQMTGNNA